MTGNAISRWLLSGILLASFTAQTAKANKEMPRTLQKMQSESTFVLDGEVVDIVSKQATQVLHTKDNPIVSKNYEATFRIAKKIKGEVQGGVVTLIYSRIDDPRFEGDIPPLLKVNDRFRLFADKLENQKLPPVIRIRTANAVRPEGFDKKEVSLIDTTTPGALQDPLPSAQIAETTNTDSEILERLKTINESLSDRMVDPASPEGIFLGSLPKKKPFSHAVMNQLILMVDIEEKAPSTKERPSLTANSPCVRALISARAQSIEPIKDALKRGDLPPKFRTILEELEALIPKVIAADERRKERKAQRARPAPSNSQ